MTIRRIPFSVTRLLAGAACLLATASCGGELLRTGRAPVFLIMSSLEAARGSSPGTFTTNLLSDVQTMVDMTINGETVRVPTTFNDLGRATIRVELKDPTVTVTTPSAINTVTINRYRVNFRRTDGQNQPGRDVPFGFDGGVTASIGPGQEVELPFDLVRHSHKSEPPLRNLINGGGLSFIYTIAEITFYGRDQNGNEVVVTGTMDVAFGDFGDDQ